MNLANKCVLISIRPKWCEKIASGKKTIEVRKNRPKLETPFKCYIYCTLGEKLLTKSHYNGSIYIASNRKHQATLERNGNKTLNGKVIGEFVCDNIVNLFADSRFWLDEKAVEQSCLTGEQIRAYANGKDFVYGWHISALQIYDKPKELSCKFGYATYPEDIETYEDTQGRSFEQICLNRVKHPPQSWLYCEQLETSQHQSEGAQQCLIHT